MNCKEVQKKIVPFIEDKLSVEDLEGFLKHMDACSECREEYDIYYTIIMGMHYLDETDEKKGFRIDSKAKLKSAADYLLKFRILHTEKIILFIMICLWFVAFAE